MTSIIEVRCTCGKKLRAKPKLAGKTVTCPNCQTQLSISQAGASAEDSASANLELTLQSIEQPVQPELETPVWFVRNSQGQQFGPMTKAQMDTGVTNGSVTVDCQVWQDGQAPMMATQLFPQLAGAPQSGVPSALPLDSGLTPLPSDGGLANAAPTAAGIPAPSLPPARTPLRGSGQGKANIPSDGQSGAKIGTSLLAMIGVGPTFTPASPSKRNACGANAVRLRGCPVTGLVKCSIRVGPSNSS